MQRLARTVQNCAADLGDLTGSVLDLVVAAPVVVQRQVLGCAMLGSTVEIILRQFKEGFRDEFPYFLRESGTLDPQVDSCLFLQTWPKRKWPRSSCTWQWHAFCWFAGEIAPRAVFPKIAAMTA